MLWNLIFRFGASRAVLTAVLLSGVGCVNIGYPGDVPGLTSAPRDPVEAENQRLQKAVRKETDRNGDLRKDIAKLQEKLARP